MILRAETPIRELQPIRRPQVLQRHRYKGARAALSDSNASTSASFSKERNVLTLWEKIFVWGSMKIIAADFAPRIYSSQEQGGFVSLRTIHAPRRRRLWWRASNCDTIRMFEDLALKLNAVTTRYATAS